MCRNEGCTLLLSSLIRVQEARLHPVAEQPDTCAGVKEYSTAIDMWSVGCIMGELLQNKALLPGKSELEQLNKIFTLVGSPTAENWPTHSELPNMKKVLLLLCSAT